MASIPSLANSSIYSTLSDDLDLAPIVEMFVEEIPQRIAAMEMAATRQDWPTLERLAHQIKGAGGSYGFEQTTAVAGKLERAVHERQPVDAIMLCLYETIDLCRRMRTSREFTL